MPERVTVSRLANTIAKSIRRAFSQSQDEFCEITARAFDRFVKRDWHSMQADSAERLDVYSRAVERIAQRCRELLEDRAHSRPVWMSIKAVYSGLIDRRSDFEIAETFFNSVTRRIFTTVGVDNDIEFVHTDYEKPPTKASEPVYRTYSGCESSAALIQTMLIDTGFPFPQELLENESAVAGEVLDQRLRAAGALKSVERAEMVKSVFYRGEYAYLVGRLFSGAQTMPLVVCLRSTAEGIVVDAVLTDENDVSRMFSFARSYFHVQVERPYDLVSFIQSIIPRKRKAEIYISIGYNKHGKTELYRNALRHLAASDDKYELARGRRGMVMAVFTMPSYAVVFKIIKDEFDYPKSCTHEDVINKYHLVFRHDRAGRLIDAQEYKYLELERDRFADDCLEELMQVASRNVFVRDDKVVIKHCYAERRVTPLDLYLQEADEEAARAAVIDYGDCLKDLARTNIFPGDLMLKNFGVTRHGRVVFYDYDEISLLTDCSIRELPSSDDYDDELSAEPWYAVGQNDMFPEEFARFLALPEPFGDLFREVHGDLFQVDFWREIQRQLKAGVLFHVAPYGEDARIVRAADPAVLKSPAFSTEAQTAARRSG